MGQEGVSSTRITEIPAGETTRPLKFSLDEVVYVVSGRGLTTIWYDGSSTKKNFEWQQHSMFLVPHGTHHQFSNMQGDKPLRLLHYSYLPLGLSAVPASTLDQAGRARRVRKLRLAPPIPAVPVALVTRGTGASNPRVALLREALRPVRATPAGRSSAPRT